MLSKKTYTKFISAYTAYSFCNALPATTAACRQTPCIRR